MLNISKIYITLSFVASLFYFSYHALYGSRGYLAYNKLNSETASYSKELNDVREQRAEIFHTVKLLRPDSLDKDMLEEHAKRILGLASEDEKIVISE